ncbi:hypothetical protein MYK68_13900 [Gordonia sp. PP30]|uniref:hypothetical protein n=1 Tax=Gordonia sp. PP30 TaxID=2935861 RepID=UPI001FFF2DF9|nr:hypothetical protein [Gordonia sp. PP30]UQE73824.1 hypothetical protein MYK68_13900 [Gordonia sp. PP30]
MRRTVTVTVTVSVVALAVTLAACSSNDSTTNEIPSQTKEPVDVAFLKENLVVVSGNVVTLVNNARETNFEGENATDGGVYDVASIYDQMTPECKTRITRSAFRRSFIDKIVPLIDDAQPERITVSVDPAK